MRYERTMPRELFLACCPADLVDRFKRELSRWDGDDCEEVEFTVNALARIDSESSPRPATVVKLGTIRLPSPFDGRRAIVWARKDLKAKAGEPSWQIVVERSDGETEDCAMALQPNVRECFQRFRERWRRSRLD